MKKQNRRTRMSGRRKSFRSNQYYRMIEKHPIHYVKPCVLRRNTLKISYSINKIKGNNKYQTYGKRNKIRKTNKKAKFAKYEQGC